MSIEVRERIKTRVGLFFTSLEMKERVGILVDLFFMSIEMRERVGSSVPLFHKHVSFLIQGLTIKTGKFLKIGDFSILWYNGKS